jgi:Ca2+:H+ antiporter
MSLAWNDGLMCTATFGMKAEQVSALIFAYKDEMDLCIGITVGSAVQIALFVLPGSVLIGWVMDRSMSLFFRGFETCCLIFSVVSVAAVLQGGTTNWLVGTYLLGVYLMISASFWYHELENLSIDGELHNLHNHSSTES